MTGPESYSLRQVARMFRQDSRTIKRRIANGELPHYFTPSGRLRFPREALLDHLDELRERNNRIG